MRNTILVILMFWMNSGLRAQSDSLGLPGDQLDLYGVLELFRTADNPEAFEKALNTESNQVNNLDLNQNGEIDYIVVNDETESDMHAIVLQVYLSEKEIQDVAVIEIEKTGNENAMLQIVGDEDLYGSNFIVEPNDETSDKEMLERNRGAVIVNVWFWPCVRFIYVPAYRPWRSPWHWKHYPGWWRPWRPVAWHVYHPRVRHYHVRYHRVTVHRTVRVHKVYHPHRKHSKAVRQIHRTPARQPQNVRKTPGKTPGGKAKSAGGRPQSGGGKRGR